MAKDTKKTDKKPKTEKVKGTTYNLRDFASSIAEDKAGVSTGVVYEILSELFSSIENTVKEGGLKVGDKVNLPGLGQLLCVQKKERKSRNPRTGETWMAPARPAVKFRLASGMRTYGKVAHEEKPAKKADKKSKK